MMKRCLFVFLLSAASCGCTGGDRRFVDAGIVDAGSGHDAGSGLDASLRDAGGGEDAGVMLDAGGEEDAGSMDAAVGCGDACGPFEQCLEGACYSYPACRGDGTCDDAADVCHNRFCVPGDADPDGDGSLAAVDCDETDPERYPGRTEVCNSVDDDCDDLVDEGCGDAG